MQYQLKIKKETLRRTKNSYLYAAGIWITEMEKINVSIYTIRERCQKVKKKAKSNITNNDTNKNVYCKSWESTRRKQRIA